MLGGKEQLLIKPPSNLNSFGLELMSRHIRRLSRVTVGLSTDMGKFLPSSIGASIVSDSIGWIPSCIPHPMCGGWKGDVPMFEGEINMFVIQRCFFVQLMI